MALFRWRIASERPTKYDRIWKAVIRGENRHVPKGQSTFRTDISLHYSTFELNDQVMLDNDDNM